MDEAINIIVLEEETLELLEALQLRYVGRANDVVKAHILERNLLNGLLEIQVVQDLEGIAVNEKFVVTFNFSMARLHKALRS